MARLFRENGVDYEKVNYFNDPLTEDKIRDLVRKMGVSPYEILRRGEAAAKELGITPETPGDEIIRHIAAHPSILQRPIVEVGDKAVLARPIDKAAELIKNESVE